jgi:hypothetical protein
VRGQRPHRAGHSEKLPIRWTILIAGSTLDARCSDQNDPSVAFDDTDRRRFFLATTLTLLALPALWWANQSDGAGAPNVAVVGVGVAESDGDAVDTTIGQSLLPAKALLGDTAPVFLDGPAGAGPGVAEVAVPAPPAVARITTKATFRSTVTGDTCIVPGAVNGTALTIVNLNNNRSVRCVAVLAPDGTRDEVVLPATAFSELADLTDAPIWVELRQ